MAVPIEFGGVLLPERKHQLQLCQPVGLRSRRPAAQRHRGPHPSPQCPLHHSPLQLGRETGCLGLGAQGRGRLRTKRHPRQGREQRHLIWRGDAHPYDRNHLQKQSQNWMNAIILHWAWSRYSVGLTITTGSTLKLAYWPCCQTLKAAHWPDKQVDLHYTTQHTYHQLPLLQCGRRAAPPAQTCRAVPFLFVYSRCGLSDWCPAHIPTGSAGKKYQLSIYVAVRCAQIWIFFLLGFYFTIFFLCGLWIFSDFVL